MTCFFNGYYAVQPNLSYCQPNRLAVPAPWGGQAFPVRFSAGSGGYGPVGMTPRPVYFGVNPFAPAPFFRPQPAPLPVSPLATRNGGPPTVVNQYFTAPPPVNNKNQWKKFAWNTAANVAGLSIAAYFGMKILPRRIAQEMGAQIKINLLSSAQKRAILQEAIREPQRLAAKTRHRVQHLLDAAKKHGYDKLSLGEQTDLEKKILADCDFPTVFSRFTQETCNSTFTKHFVHKLMNNLALDKAAKGVLASPELQTQLNAMTRTAVEETLTPAYLEQKCREVLQGMTEGGQRNWLLRMLFGTDPGIYAPPAASAEAAKAVFEKIGKNA